MDIGDRIRSVRMARGLTQSDLGKRSGMADSAIRRYESNRVNPTATTLQRIAAALDVSVDYLLGTYQLKGILNYKTAAIRGRIFESAEQAGLSKEELCAKLGLPIDEWFKWEEASSTSYLDYLPEIAKLLGISENVLSGKKADTTPTDRMRLIAAFDNLNLSGQQEAVKRVEELAEIERYQKEKKTADGI